MPSFKRERCGKRIQPAEDKTLMVAGGKQREDVSVYVWDILYAKSYYSMKGKVFESTTDSLAIAFSIFQSNCNY